MSKLRYLFSLRAPVIYDLEYLDMVIQDKILLLISWHFKRPYLLSIPGLNKKYREKASAVIVKVPSHMEVVNIQISSAWRKKKITVVLRKWQLDEDTSQHIIQQFQPFRMPALTLPEIGIRDQELPSKSPIPLLKKYVLKVNSNQTNVKSDKLTYPH